MQKKQVAVYIGKFQIPHLAHTGIMKDAINHYDELIVLVGSTNRRMSILHPFPFNTIRTWIKDVDSKIIVKPIKDYIYNDTKWITEVESSVYGEFLGEDVQYTLVGHHKDDSSYYLDIFPNFMTKEFPSLENGLSSTNLRNDLFNVGYRALEGFVSKKVFEDLSEFVKTEDYENLVDEANFYKKEKEIFSTYPYPDTLKFNCSDAVVVCDGNVLLIQRKINPGKDVWALPGGFTNTNETYKEGAIRELIEETGIKIPQRALELSIKSSAVFDHPKRNIGIPRISMAFFFEVLPDIKKGVYRKLPKVKGSDDANDAKWFPISEVRNMKLFDDHSDVIDYFTNSI